MCIYVFKYFFSLYMYIYVCMYVYIYILLLLLRDRSSVLQEAMVKHGTVSADPRVQPRTGFLSFSAAGESSASVPGPAISVNREVHNREVHRDTHAVFLEMDISSSDQVEVMEEDMMAQLPREGEFPATLGINSNQARDSDLQPNI